LELPLRGNYPKGMWGPDGPTTDRGTGASSLEGHENRRLFGEYRSED